MCSWLTSVEWAKWGPGKKIWDAAKSEVHAPQPVKAPLPSDSRYRGDLKALLVRLCTPDAVCRDSWHCAAAVEE